MHEECVGLGTQPVIILGYLAGILSPIGLFIIDGPDLVYGVSSQLVLEALIRLILDRRLKLITGNERDLHLIF